ncbi:unnamed protein product (macronuclear) [Paramecium tetraurelia]|uniref:Uncharacterized protein n=1 Tax=Paramecium tetraurelia TaxID=5888 RepID=A0DKM1_PARTE|nr:uncharacterized protein GSPATT00017918001 [Paramecium tetraurelia]CAK83588.1 unnamed protein product [Paramecium tetraurelia]|eukprot:XP_001450985.1 hypothetical protein (macronuclear) [Paramecium tetraurelia strain d4-2]
MLKMVNAHNKIQLLTSSNMINSQSKDEDLIKKILNHLNTTCSYGQVFELDTSEDIQLEQPKYRKQQLKKLIEAARKAFKKLCEDQLKQIKGVIVPNAFKLQMSFDVVKNQALKIPFKTLFYDKLILNPLFCDFWVIVEKISKSENALDEIQKIDADEYYVILLFWKLRQLLIRKHQNNAKFEILLYPHQLNFGICKIENNKETIYFHKIDHKIQFLIKNSLFHNTISTAIQQKKLKQFQVVLFEKNDEIQLELFNAEINNQLKTKRTSFGKKISSQFTKNNIQYKIKYEKRRGLFVQNSRKPGGFYYEGFVAFENTNKYPKYRYEYLYLFQEFHIRNPINYYQSVICLNDDDWQDNLKHFIKLELNDDPICECGRQFGPYDCDTFMIDSKINQTFKYIIQQLIVSKEYLLYTTLISQPIFVEIETREYDNQFFVLYYDKEDKDYTIKKKKIMEILFQGKILNYDLDQIKDREERSLFEEDYYYQDYNTYNNYESAGLNQVINEQTCKLKQK